MDKDRTIICRAISDMLDNPNKVGIYPTSTCYTKLEHYIKKVRMEALGWCHAYFCTELDNGNDPRLIEIPKLMYDSIRDLED